MTSNPVKGSATTKNIHSRKLKTQQSTLKSADYILYTTREKIIDTKEYDQFDSPSSSSNVQISMLNIIAKNLTDRLESLERNQTEMMDKLNELEKKIK